MSSISWNYYELYDILHFKNDNTKSKPFQKKKNEQKFKNRFSQIAHYQISTKTCNIKHNKMLQITIFWTDKIRSFNLENSFDRLNLTNFDIQMK